MTERLFFRQLLAGHHHALDNTAAGQMANFAYLVGDAVEGSCVVVDPSWDPKGLMEIIEENDLRLSGILCTHSHADHVGGELFGIHVDGVAELVAMAEVPVHVHQAEADSLCRGRGIDPSALTTHQDGDVIHVGEIAVDALHTPGHTPGGLCYVVEGRLLAGDTLFVMACGRIDLPGGDPDEMYKSLTVRLAGLPDETLVYPGHHYGPRPTSTLGDERRHNPCLQPTSLQEWRRMMGAPSTG